ncbi:AAA family ATPase [Caballeronia sp. LZ033]|uniref:AAA family ATPase n=1 Tax=Caballeronia sp. LZ033 TaxID=3038566 RepID=UPI00285D6B2B|nr:AAA family ATPase [Caballeronia sp. LZ033]MDR5812071.1 AAA family ATPase [Caballeronia sp. LZ033]
MAYISGGQLTLSLESLQRFHAFFGVTFLSMKQTGVQVGTPTVWGSQQEEALLAQYFSPNGSPPGKPYCVPFGRKDPNTWFWKNSKYSGGTLQSARSRDAFSQALQHPTEKEWAFAPDYLEKLEALLPLKQRIPVFDLTAWLYRDKDLPASLDDVESRFREEFKLNDSEYARLFDATRPVATQFFWPEPVPEEDLAQLIHGVPPGPSMLGRSEAELIQHLERWVTEEEGLALPTGFVRAFYGALVAQRFVVLAGRPGTGKTAFVRAFTEGLSRFFANSVSLVEVSVGSDFSEADVLGYEKISGGLAATELSRKLFLSERPRDVYVILLDEMNLSHVDHYLARLLPALESDAKVELPGLDSASLFPPDAFIVGTVNSFLEESTRFALSNPVKRRANIVEMPNALGTLVAENDRKKFDKACIDLLKQTKGRIDKRQKDGAPSVLDAFRLERLSAALISGSDMRSDSFGDILWRVCQICSGSAATSLTFGVVQDILDYVAMSGRPWRLALGEQLANKVVPQLSGPANICEELLMYVVATDEGAGDFGAAISALEAIMQTKDAATGHVVYRY